MNTIELLDAAKAKTGSDNKTAQRLGITAGYVSRIRNGEKPLSPYQAARLCELIGEKWHQGCVQALADQAKSTTERGFWIKKLHGLAKNGTLALVMAMPTIGENLKNANETINGLRNTAENIYYTKHHIFRTGDIAGHGHVPRRVQTLN